MSTRYVFVERTAERRKGETAAELLRKGAVIAYMGGQEVVVKIRRDGEFNIRMSPQQAACELPYILTPVETGLRLLLGNCRSEEEKQVVQAAHDFVKKLITEAHMATGAGGIAFSPR